MWTYGILFFWYCMSNSLNVYAQVEELDQSPSFSVSGIDVNNHAITSNEFHFSFMENVLQRQKAFFKKGKRASHDAVHEVVFVVKQRNLGILEALVQDIASPQSENYGKYLSREEITTLVRNTDSVKFLVSFLEFHDLGHIVHRSLADEFITVSGTVEKWERLFHTELFEYNPIIDDKKGKKSTKKSIIRAEKYYLPNQLLRHVESVFGLTQFPDRLYRHKITKPLGKPMAEESKTITLSTENSIACDANTPYSLGFTQPCLLNQLYSVQNNSGAYLGSQAIYGDLEQTFSPSDLAMFQDYFNLPAYSLAFNVGGHVNDTFCKTASSSCDEANLDVQYIMAMGQRIPTWYYYWNGTGTWDDWLVQVASMASPPLVFSISYVSYESSLSNSIIAAFQIEAIKLAAMGVTLVAASGDDGVSGWLSRGSSDSCGYHPMFPASSPYVTAVGGTQGPEQGKVEVACQGDAGGVITTGGGFSTVIKAHSWQRAYITSYFANVSSQSSGNLSSSPASGYNSQGRGYPDVSLLATAYRVFVGGQIVSLYGTSASAPVFAGMVALINSKRLSLSLPPVGWINPSLYAYASNFTHDISSGNNKCCLYGNPCCTQGFTAIDGWDPVTGFGSVNFTAMKDTFIRLALEANSSNESQAPSLSPTVLPATSAAPTTSAPTVSSGYLYSYLYSEAGCTGTVVSIQAFPVQQCLPVYGSATSSILYYRRYSCGSGNVGMSETFSDSLCSNKISTTMYDLSASACTTVEDGYYYFTGNEINYSSRLFCTTTASVNSILPANGINYFRNTTYSSASCSTVSTVQYWVPDYCYEIATANNVYRSYMIYAKTATSVQMNYYYSTQCTGGFSYVSLNTGSCYNYFIKNTSCRTVMYALYVAPTMTPTVAPTCSPTFSPSTHIPTTFIPTIRSTEFPTVLVTATNASNNHTTTIDSGEPTLLPTQVPFPSINPTYAPSQWPSPVPSAVVSSSLCPSAFPHESPSNSPTSLSPSQLSPTEAPFNVLGTPVPSLSPSAVPPTSVKYELSLNVTHTLNNISFSVYQLHVTEYNFILLSALYNTIAPVLTPPLYLNLTRDFFVTDINPIFSGDLSSANNRRWLQWSYDQVANKGNNNNKLNNVGIATLTEFVSVTTSITIRNITTSSDSSQTMEDLTDIYDLIVTSLQLSLANGTFNELLSNNNAYFTVQNMTFSNLSMITDTDDGGFNHLDTAEDSSWWTQIGSTWWMLVVISVGGVCVVSSCIYGWYSCFRHTSVQERSNLQRSANKYTVDPEVDAERGPPNQQESLDNHLQMQQMQKKKENQYERPQNLALRADETVSYF